MQHSLTTGFFPQLSVIIPTMNESRTLPELLEGLERQRQIQLEVIVCDGGWKYLSTGAYTDDLDEAEAKAEQIIYF